MKVGVFTKSFPSVSQTFVIRQCTALIDRGHDVTIFARRPKSSEPVHEDVRHYGLVERMLNWRAPPSPREAARWARPEALRLASRAVAQGPMGLPVGLAERPLAALRARELSAFDIVLAHFGPQGILADWLQTLGLLRGPIVTVFHGFDVSGFVQRTRPDVYAGLFERGAFALAVSERWATRLRELGCPRDRIHVLRMGVRLDELPFRPRHREASEPLRLLAVGRLVEKKGFVIALEALASRREALGDFRLDIIGDGPERARLEAATHAARLDDRVRFRGAQPADFVRNALNDAHILLAPSHTSRTGDQEGIPVVLMEAMAMGLPVISTRHSGIPELVPDESLVPEKDPRALADRIVDVVTRARDWPGIGRAGREIVEREFSADVVDDRLDALLRSIASDRPTAP